MPRLPAGLASGAGVYVAAAGGGVVVDVDGNSLIDLGSGIAVTTVGNAAPAVVARATDQLARYTHTCFLATPYEPYIAVAEALNRLTPGEHPKRTALFNTGAEAVETDAHSLLAHLLEHRMRRLRRVDHEVGERLSGAFSPARSPASRALG